MQSRIRCLIEKPLLPVILLCGVLLLRLYWFYATHDDPYMQFRVGDELHYHEWAQAIAGGEWARGTAFFTTPLYAYFLAVAYTFGGEGLAYIRILNICLGVGSVVFTYLAAKEFFNRNIALITLVLAGFCSAPIFYEWFAEKTSLVLFLTAISFYFIGISLRKNSLLLWTLTGIAIGLASLAHSLLIVLLVAVNLHLLLLWLKDKVFPTALLTCTIGFCVAISPATIHNYLQNRDFVPICSHMGNTFYIGNNAGNTIGNYVSPTFSVANINNEEMDYRKEAERRAGRQLKPSAVSSYWLRQGLSEMADKPALSVQRLVRRFRWVLNAEEPSDTRTYAFYQARYSLLRFPFWGFGLISFFGLLGLLLLMVKRNGNRIIFSTTIGIFTLGLAAILVYGRYRLPLLIPLSILAAFAIAELGELLWSRQVKMLLVQAGTLIIIGLLVFTPVLPQLRTSFFTDYYNQGNRYLRLGEKELAAEEYRKAVTVLPGDDPNVPSTYLALADFYLTLNKPWDAVRLLEQAVDVAPENVAYKKKLGEVQLLASVKR